MTANAVLRTIIGPLVALAALSGCSPQGTRMNLITYDDQGKADRHFSDFGRASFRQESDKRIEVVFQGQVPSRIDPTQTITQVVCIQTFWTPLYGVTYAEKSQINAHVKYAILTPPTGICYEGAAFVTYDVDPLTKEVVGWIESGDLSPVSRMGDATEPFGPARITGNFRAVDKGGDVVNTLQMLKTQFTQPVEKK